MPQPVAALDPPEARPDLAGDLRVAVSRLARRLRTTTGGGLTSSQLSAMFAIEGAGPLRLAELSALEGVSAPTITRIVDRLEEAGLARRGPDPGDRRSTRVAVTAKGRAEMRRIRTQRTAFLHERLAQLSPAERAALEAALPVLKALAEGGSV